MGYRSSLTSYVDDNGETLAIYYLPTEEEKAAQQAFIAEVWKLYNSGVPLFTKEMIKLAQKQMSQLPLPEQADVLGFDGKLYPMSLVHLRHPTDTSGTSNGEVYVPALHFSCIESMTQPSPGSPPGDRFLSIGIGGRQLRKTTQASGISQETVDSEFAKNLNLWENGESWKTVEASLAPYLSTLSRTVNKIIGFGLGEVTTPSGPYNHPDLGRRRACTQHALMITLAKLLERSQKGDSRAETHVKCYVQDPAYYDTCKRVLASHGVEVLEPENGFLMVDEESAVLSFSPNIPVHQLVADLARPAIMIWGKIEEPVKREWQRMEDDVWLSPYTTDPISPRVLAMASEYVELPFMDDDDDDDLFSTSAVYVRRNRKAAERHVA